MEEDPSWSGHGFAGVCLGSHAASMCVLEDDGTPVVWSTRIDPAGRPLLRSSDNVRDDGLSWGDEPTQHPYLHRQLP